MNRDWQPPENHPITEAMARQVLALTGRPSRELISSCCVPLYCWAAQTLAHSPGGVAPARRNPLEWRS